MSQRDERPDERRRQHNPAWATVPTMPWRRVAAEEGLEEEEIERVEQYRRGDAEHPHPGLDPDARAPRQAGGHLDRDFPERGFPERDPERGSGDRGHARVPRPDLPAARGSARGGARGVYDTRGDRALIERGATESDETERLGDRGGQGLGERYPAEQPPRPRPGERPRPVDGYGKVAANPQRGPRRGAIHITPPGVQPGLYAGNGHRVISPDALTAPTPPGGVPFSGTAAMPSDGLADEETVLSTTSTEDDQETAASALEGTALAEDTGPDPEHILATWEWSFDPETLRELADDPDGLRDVRDQLTAKLNTFSDNPRRARLLSLRAVVSRILGDLPKALADGKLALAHAEATGELRRIAIAQARLAHVLQWRGEFEEADRLFALANSSELPDRLRATMHQHAGKCAYDQGRYIEACNHFERALELRKDEDPELITQTEMALDAVFTKVAQNGWGPYPRGRDEILQLGKPPTPALDERTGLWGYIDAAGDTVIAAGYDDVQPFRDGVAWVQRPDMQNWELIDEAGQTLIPGRAGYVGVSSFSDGLAWVSRDGNARWIGIDKDNNVTISTGFDDVRPFRRGMAAVRRGRRWGAVDGVGRVIVPFAYDGFATALSDGRYIDGFSDEGLAVVELGGRKGVVDRAGRVLVEPVHPAVVIHPVAFLITDGTHRWGALDRRGRMLIPPTHPSRMGVSDEIDRLLSDARPVL